MKEFSALKANITWAPFSNTLNGVACVMYFKSKWEIYIS